MMTRVLGFKPPGSSAFRRSLVILPATQSCKHSINSSNQFITKEMEKRMVLDILGITRDFEGLMKNSRINDG